MYFWCILWYKIVVAPGALGALFLVYFGVGGYNCVYIKNNLLNCSTISSKKYSKKRLTK